MTNRPVVNTLHSDNSAGHNTACAGDYPVRLLTKRTLALDAARILHDRANSPQQVRPTGSRRPY